MPKGSAASQLIREIELAAKEILKKPEYEGINLLIEQDTRGKFPSVIIRAKGRRQIEIRHKKRTAA